MCELDELTAQLLARHGPAPAWLAGGRDRLKEAWDSCDDVAAMITFLRAAAEVGAVAIDGYTESGGATGVSRWLDSAPDWIAYPTRHRCAPGT
jgi:hypothetical protein